MEERVAAIAGSKKNAVIICGASGTGKTTLIERLLQKNSFLEFAVSVTTKTLSEEEVLHKKYEHVDEVEFFEMLGNHKLVEADMSANGNHYGTTYKEIQRISALKKTPVLDLNIEGMVGARTYLIAIGYRVFVIFLEASPEVRETRLLKRKREDLEKIAQRVMEGSVQDEKAVGCRYFIDVTLNTSQMDKAAIENAVTALLIDNGFF